MMKKFVCVIAALCMLAACAVAEEYVTIGELRDQIKEGWNETYTAKGREVVAKVEMDWFPEDAESCPLVTVDPLVIEEDDPRLDKWEAPYSSIYALPDRVVIDMTNDKKFRLVNDYRGKWLEDHYVYYDGEIPDREPEYCDITFEEFMTMFKADLLELTGLSLDDVHIDEIRVNMPGYKGKKKDGEYVRGDQLTASGGYYIFTQQLAYGIPVLGSNQGMDKGRAQYGYYMPEYRLLCFWTVTNPTVIKEDLPLLSFDAFKGKLEKLIDAGKLRGVDAMRFGYGVCKDGKTWKLVPVWMVTCGYTDDPNYEKHVMPYVDRAGDLVHPEKYREYYFNAQTGEMMEDYEINRYEASLRMPKILTWDDVK